MRHNYKFINKYFISILLLLIVFCVGCAALIDETVNSALYKTHKISLEINGNNERAEMSYLTKLKRDEKTLTPKETAQLGNSNLLESSSEELKRDIKIKNLPFQKSFIITTGDHLCVYCRPYQTNKLITLKIIDNNKILKEQILQPDNLGIYIDYVPAD